MAYCTRAEVRALDQLDDEATYPDAVIDDAILLAEDRIDDESGTSWTYKTHVLTLDGNGRADIFTAIPFLRTVTACTVSAVVEDVTDWVGTDDGFVRRQTGVFTASAVGRNVALTVTAGATATPPADIAYAARTLARWYVLQSLSRVPANALSVTSEYGTSTFVQPGGPMGNPTALPELNRILLRRNHRPPAVG